MPTISTAAHETALRRILKAEGRTQTWLSEATGIPYDPILRIVSGKRLPNVLEARAIASALGRDIDELFVGSVA